MTFRTILCSAAAGVAMAAVGDAAAQAGGKPLEFPAAADGRLVLAVDLHMHTVFSDGDVWPTLRVQEAARDGTALIAVTDHLEWQPKRADIPNIDRNRPYAIAQEGAAGVLVVNGAEITRGQPVGHINAVFLSDANRLVPPGEPARTGEDMRALWSGSDAASLASARASIDAAKSQGGFVFINHPTWTGQSKDGLLRLSAFHREIIADKALDGIEVANGDAYSDEAFRIALENDLAILGVSDIHGLIAWDYETEFNGLGKTGAPGVRTATLVLARERTPEAIRKALFDRRTVAIQSRTLFGRERDLRPIVDGALTLKMGPAVVEYGQPTDVYPLTVSNAAPLPFTLRIAPGLYDSAKVLSVPARSSVTVRLTAVKAPATVRSMTVEVLNAYAAPDRPLKLDLAVDRAAN